MFSLKNNKKDRQASQFWYMFFQLAKSCVLFFFFPQAYEAHSVMQPKRSLGNFPLYYGCKNSCREGHRAHARSSSRLPHKILCKCLMVLSSHPVLRQVNTASLCVGSLSCIVANPDPQRLVLEEELLEEPSCESDLCPETGFTFSWRSLCS